MRVMIMTKGGRHVWLAGNPALNERVHSSVADFRKVSTIDKQEGHFIRAAQVKLWDRQNVKTTLSFSTTRKFGTVPAAEEWMLDHEASYPRTGTLVLESILAGGAIVRRYMGGTVVNPPELSHEGVSVLIRYTAEGGIITTTAPAF